MSLTKQDLGNIQDIILDALNVVVNPRFDYLEAKVEGLDNRMSNMEIRFGGLENRVDGLESAQHETNRRLSSVETRLTNVEGGVMALHNDVIELYEMAR